MLLSDPEQFSTRLGSNPFDNPGVFRDVSVGETGAGGRQGFFSVVAPFGPDDMPGGLGGSFRYGVIDEAGKINLNALFKLDSSGTLLYNTLMNVPNMTDDVANSIIYWIDPTATPRGLLPACPERFRIRRALRCGPPGAHCCGRLAASRVAAGPLPA